MKEFGDVEVQGFVRTGGKKKYRTRKNTKSDTPISCRNIS